MIEAFAVLLRPLFAAWDQEFGGRPTATPHHPLPASQPPAPVVVPTAPEPAETTDDEPATEPVAEPTPEPTPSVDAPTAELVTTPTENRSANDPPTEATAEPLYVRRGAGRGARYDVAPPDASGQRFRLLVVGKRKRFTPVEARR